MYHFYKVRDEVVQITRLDFKRSAAILTQRVYQLPERSLDRQQRLRNVRPKERNEIVSGGNYEEPKEA